MKISARAQRALVRGQKDDKAVVVRSPRIRSLEHQSFLMASRVQDWIEARDGVKIRLALKRIDRLKLLRLRTWEIQTKLDLFEILDIVVPPIREHSKLKLSQSDERYGLGTSVSSITGDLAQQILSTIIERTYPDNEHLTVWRELERDRQLEAERLDTHDAKPREGRKFLKDFDSPEDYVRYYTSMITKLRDRDLVEGDAKWRRRKAYRNNPWK